VGGNPTGQGLANHP